MKDFVFLMGFLSLFVFEISRAITWEDERESFISRFQDLYKEDIDIHEKIVEKDKKIEKLIEQVDLQNETIESLKIENKALRSKTTQNENKIDNILEIITNLSGMYFYSNIVNVYRQNNDH